MQKIKKIIEHPLFSGSVVMIGGSMMANVINYIYHLAMGRILGPVNYGVLASLFSILYIVSIIPTSTSISIVKFISSAKNFSDASKVYSAINKFVLIIAIALSVITLAASPLIANFLHINNIFLVLIISPILFFSLITLVNQASSQGRLKFMGFVVPGLVSSIVKIVLGVALVIAGFSVLGAMFGVLTGAFLAYFSSLPYIKKLKNNKTFKENYKLQPFIKYSVPVLLQAMAFTSIFTTDVILVKHFLSPFDAGIYAALSTLGKIVFFAASPISSVMFPVIAGRNAKGQEYFKVFWGSFALTFLISAVVVIAYLIFPKLAISLLYGNAYLVGASSLVWMGVFILIYTLAVLLVNLSLSLGKTKIIFFPLIASVLQIFLIWSFHTSINQIIINSLIISTLMLFGEGIYLGYNHLSKKYAKTQS